MTSRSRVRGSVLGILLGMGDRSSDSLGLDLRSRRSTIPSEFPPDADGNGNYAFFDAANYALIQMTGGVTAISAV